MTCQDEPIGQKKVKGSASLKQGRTPLLALAELRGESGGVVNRQEFATSGIFLKPASGIEPSTCSFWECHRSFLDML